MKNIVGVELSHQHAPLSVREKISLTTDDVRLALKTLKSEVREIFIIATCNRLSIYGVTEDISPILRFFDQFGDLRQYLSVYLNYDEAVRHLFATAAGLESQALGEHEILGQIKKAYYLAQEEKSVGPVMDEFIRRAISIGKKVRKETAIGKYPVSLASVAYDLVKGIHKDFSKLKVLVLGTGEMSSIMLKILGKKSLTKLYIASRTAERAQTLAHMYSGEAISLDNIDSIISDVDVIVGATNAPSYILKKADLENKENRLPKTLVDLGLPRNFDPELKYVDRVSLFDLDDLKAITSEGMQKRQEEVPRAMEMIETEIIEFDSWVNARKVSPLISSYYEKLDQIRNEELNWALPKLGDLSEAQQKIIENLLSRLTRRVSGKPIEMLRHYSQEPEQEKSPIETFKQLFDL